MALRERDSGVVRTCKSFNKRRKRGRRTKNEDRGILSQSIISFTCTVCKVATVVLVQWGVKSLHPPLASVKTSTYFRTFRALVFRVRTFVTLKRPR